MRITLQHVQPLTFRKQHQKIRTLHTADDIAQLTSSELLKVNPDTLNSLPREVYAYIVDSIPTGLVDKAEQGVLEYRKTQIADVLQAAAVELEELEAQNSWDAEGFKFLPFRPR